jgi:hypothetical protein
MILFYLFNFLLIQGEIWTIKKRHQYKKGTNNTINAIQTKKKEKINRHVCTSVSSILGVLRGYFFSESMVLLDLSVCLVGLEFEVGYTPVNIINICILVSVNIHF